MSQDIIHSDSEEDKKRKIDSFTKDWMRVQNDLAAQKPEIKDASVTDVLTMWNEELAALDQVLMILTVKLRLVLQPGESPIYSGDPKIAPGGQVPVREGLVPVVSLLLSLYGRIEHITETVKDLNNRVRI